MEEKKILIVSGEPSGDLHGSNLVRSLKNEKNIKFFGIGGEKLRKEGVELLGDINKIAVMGFFEIIKKLPYIYFVFNKILIKVKKERPSLAILIDYPGFNFILMKKLYKMKIPVVYYICPQVWAWKPERIYKLKKYTVKRLVIFPFEEEFFKNYGIEANYVGHPLLDNIKIEERKNSEKIKIGIFPGSRKTEIKYLLPFFIELLLFLKEKIDNVEFYIKIYEPMKYFILNKLKKYNLSLNILKEEIIKLDFSIMASGTVTLENALAGNLGIVLYKVNPLTYKLFKNKVNTKYISITNILLNEMVYEEFLQEKINVENIKKYVLNLILDKDKLNEKKEKLLKLKDILKYGAVENAKREILKLL